MKLLACLLFCINALFSTAQRTIDVNKNEVSGTSPSLFMVVGGTPFVTARFAKVVSGTPFFSDEWLKGTVAVNGGHEYAGLLLKLDLLDNELHYMDTKGIEMIATSALQKVLLFDTLTQRVFAFINSSFINAGTPVQKGWYQLLVQGEVTLFKQYHKIIREDKPYNSATVEQYIDTSPRYFVLYKNSFAEIKKMKDLPDIFKDRKEQLVKYIKDNKLTGKTDEDYSVIVNFYIELIKQ